MLNDYKAILFSLLFLVGHFISHSKEFKHYGIDEGMPSSIVYSIDQDSLGLMWFGTNSGLVSFDGSIFEKYDLSGFYAESNFVNKIKVDGKNRIWLGTSKGLYFYESITGRIKQPDTKHAFLKELVIRELDIDSEENIWIGSNAGIYLYNEKSDSLALVSESTTEVFDILITPDGKVYAGGRFGLKCFDALQGREIPLHTCLESFRFGQVQKLKYLDSGKILFFMVNEGIREFDPESGRCVKVQSINELLKAQTMLRDIEVLKDNSLLFAFDGFGILHTDKHYSIIDHYKQDEDEFTSLKNDGVYDICPDAEGRIWVATYGGGVSMSDPYALSFKHYNHIPYNLNSLSNNTGNCVIQDSKGKIWFGTKKGISIFDEKNNSWKHLNNSQKKTLGNNTVLSMCQVSEDEIWVGTYGGSVDVVNIHNFEIHRLKGLEELNNEFSTSFVFDIKKIGNDVWLGLIRGRLTKYNLENHSIKFYPITDIKLVYPVEKNLLFLGGGNGFYLFDKNTEGYQHFEHGDSVNNGLTSNYVRCVFSLTDKLYIGTEGGGLILFNYNTKEFTNFTIKDGLPSNSVLSIVKDEQEYLWLGTKDGIVKFNPYDKQFISFNIYDGLPFNEYYEKSAVMLNSQEIILGGANGFVRFSPSTIKKVPVRKKLILKDLKISNEVVNVDDKHNVLKSCLNFTKDLHLVYNQNSFTISYSAINFLNPGRDEFFWKLKGNGMEWSDKTSQGSANFTNIPSGNYVFELSLADRSYETNNETKRLYIYIAPPFWWTNWAYSLYLLLFLLILVVTIYFIRLKYQERTARDKNKFFVNVAHDLRTPLTLIKLPLTSLAENKNLNDSDAILVKQATRNLDKLHYYFNQLMDFQKASQKRLQLVLSKNDIGMQLSSSLEIFKPLIQTKGIKVVENIQKGILFSYDKTKFDKIFYNLLSNAIKYSFNGGEIKVELYRENKDSIVIKIKDNGIGIPENQQKNIFRQYFRATNAINSSESGSGLGLVMVKQLIELHSGKIIFKSNPGAGTTFVITIPYFVKSYILKEKNLKSEGITSNKREKNNLKTILIVEDNLEIQQQVASHFFQKFEVITADNGKEGLELVKKTNPDLIISDIMMPEMDGNMMCAKLKSDFETSHIPIILLTALTGSEYKLSGYEAGADAYIEKPFEFSLLDVRVANLLKSREKLQKHFTELGWKSEKMDFVTKVDNDFMEKAIRVVEENMQNPDFSVDDFCKSIYKSRPVVYRKLKALTNKSPQDFIRHIRMQKALELLKTTSLSINEVAFSVGYTDQRYFSTTFKKEFAETPSFYRK